MALHQWFSEDELAKLAAGTVKPGLTDPDDVPAARTTTDIQPGDVLELGAHRVVCGDSTDAATVGGLLAGERIDFVVTSPPYNIGMGYRSHVDKGTRDAYLSFLAAVARAFVPHLATGRFVAWNIGVSPKTYPHRQVVVLEDAGLSFYRQLVWAKSGVPYPVFPSTIKTKRARHYSPNYTHEVIHILEAGESLAGRAVTCALCDGQGKMAARELPSEEAHETVQLLTYGPAELGAGHEPDRRYKNDVWHIAQSQATVGIKSVGTKSGTLQHGGRSGHVAKEHPAPFPVELPRALMGYLSGPKEVVFDPFGGSGSTLLACEQMARRGRLVELDPVYCQIIVDRWEAFTGQQATKAGELCAAGSRTRPS